MSTFSASQSQFNQTHFTIVEIDLPVVEGTCTLAGGLGFGTPLSCDQAANATKTYKFTNYAGVLPESNIYKCIDSITESTAKLQSGRGLASRGTLSINLIDFTGIDPNPNTAGVTDDVINSGTFFGKLNARQIVINKPVRIKNYRLESDGSIDLANGAQIRYYLADKLTSNSGKWQLICKDELARININESVWPIPLMGSLRLDINATTTTIPVDANINYLVGDTIRISDEFMKIVSVSNIGTGTATVTVATRGSNIVYTTTLTKTTADTHSQGDEIYICEISDNEAIYTLIRRILIDVGVDANRIPIADWTTEIDEWHATTRIDTIWFETKQTKDIIEKLLTDFMIDLWDDPVSHTIKMSAISVWKQSAAQLREGAEIDYKTVKIVSDEQLRSTRALMIYNKPFLAKSDGVENYTKASLFQRTDLEIPELYGEPKTKIFKYSSFLSKDAADLLTQRWVSRYIDPKIFSWTTQESKLNFNLGDVVDIAVDEDVGFNGLKSTATRAQITSIRPVYSSVGRHYAITALSYEPVFADNAEIVITGNTTDINLYNQYAGAPSSAVTIWFIFDGTICGSSDATTPAIRVGGFASGSVINIILYNDANLQAAGGAGADGQKMVYSPDETPGSRWSSPVIKNGGAGGTVIDAEGNTVNIYLSGSTGNANYPTAQGVIFAPNGGGGGFSGSAGLDDGTGAISGDGGDGGRGRASGSGGAGGLIVGGSGTIGVAGDTPTGDGQGLAGANNNSLGGAAGAGVKDSGGVVTLFGADSLNYINGTGDH